MSKYHKHDGVKDYHLITQKHKDPKVQAAHNRAVNGYEDRKVSAPAKKSVASGLKQLFSKTEIATKVPKPPALPQSMAKGVYEIDLTKQKQIEKLIIKFKDKSGKSATLSIENY